MLKTLNHYLRHKGVNGFQRRALPGAFALALLLLLPAYASAYTLVLRGGRRVEIPAKFTVTPLTITYETAPGINVTVLMASVDVEATERANNEPSGSLLKRAEAKAMGRAGGATGRGLPRKELTQADVEEARRARARSEQDYERRRKELGLPSAEETRRRNEEEVRRMSEEARVAESESAQAESYWRSRASALRGEMAALDAQILYVRTKLAEMPDYPALAGYSFVTGFPGVHTRGQAFPAVTGHPGFMRAPGTSGAQPAGFQAFGAFAATHMQAGGFQRTNTGRPLHIRPGRVAPPLPYFGAVAVGQDYSYDRATLVSRLRELEAARAGLQARWRLLEEEARRSGAPPGWLRP